MTENKDRIRLPIISGPTATGKSALAVRLARRLESQGLCAEIISADSVQVYKHMDIGTDKIPAAERKGIPHHMISIVMPDQTFSAARFADCAGRIIRNLHQQGKVPIVVGGTGFYIRALLYGLFKGPKACPEIREKLKEQAKKTGAPALHQQLEKIDPESALRIHPNDIVRIIRGLEVYELTKVPLSEHFRKQKKNQGRYYRPFFIGLYRERDELYNRINSRVEKMIEQGLVEEVKKLREMGFGPGLPSQKTLGYRRIHQYLDGRLGLDEAMDLIKRDTRHFCRRQFTWLRKEPGLVWREAASQEEQVLAELVEFVACRK